MTGIERGKMLMEKHEPTFRKVAELLGYKFVPDNPEHFYDWCGGRLTGANRESLIVRVGWQRPADRLVVSSEYPRANDNAYFASCMDELEITVSVEKTPEKMAAEIRRRLLPQYLENLATVKERIAKHEKAQDYREQVARRIAKAMEVPFKEHAHGPRDGNISIFGNGATPGLYRVNIDYSGTVQIDGRLPVETALEIIELLKTRKEGRS